MSDIAIKIENVSKHYRLGTIGSSRLRADLRTAFNWLTRRSSSLENDPELHWALRDVSFTVERGQVLGILGRNGAGKSTLLKILSRVTTPSTGRVLVKGRISSLLEVGTGFHPELTGRENVFLNGAILGMHPHEIRAKFDQIVDFSGVEKFIDTPVKRYSSGMYVRLAFAVAAHLDSDILVLDEVLAVGDSQFQRRCLRKMAEVAKGEGRTVLFVSHNLAAVQNLCRTGVYLKDGQIHASGPIEEVANQYFAESLDTLKLPLAERTDRSGNGIARFRHVEFLDEESRPIEFLTTGKPVTIRIRLATQDGQTLQNIMVALAVNNRHGHRITNWSNLWTGQLFHEIAPGECCVEISIPKLPLMPGTYSTNLYCNAQGEVVDWVKDALELVVAPGDFYGSGQLLPDGQGDFLTECEVCCTQTQLANTSITASLHGQTAQ